MSLDMIANILTARENIFETKKTKRPILFISHIYLTIHFSFHQIQLISWYFNPLPHNHEF